MNVFIQVGFYDSLILKIFPYFRLHPNNLSNIHNERALYEFIIFCKKTNNERVSLDS